MIPARSAGARPMRARRISVSCSAKPQSSMRSVPPASASSALPWLPLPRDAKRKLRLLQLLLQQGEYPAAGLGGVGVALLVEDLHLARRVAVLHVYAVLLRFRVGRGAPEHQLGEKAGVLRVDRIDLGIHVAHEVVPLRAVAVLDGKPDAV